MRDPESIIITPKTIIIAFLIGAILGLITAPFGLTLN